MAREGDQAAGPARERASRTRLGARWAAGCQQAVAWCQRLLLLAALAGLAVVAGRYWVEERLNAAVRQRVEQMLAAHYAGLRVRVRSARWLAGLGLVIRGMRIAEGGSGQTPALVEIDELVLRSQADLAALWRGSLAIQAVEVRRLTLRAERKPSGRWNVAHLWPLPRGDAGGLTRVSVAEGTLHIVDPMQRPAGTWTLRELTCHMAPQAHEGKVRLHLRASMRGEHLEKLEGEGWLDPERGTWELRGAVVGLEFNPRLRSALPREPGELAAPLASVQGRTFLTFHVFRAVPTGRSDVATGRSPASAAHSAMAAMPLWFSLEGRIAEGRIDDARLPQPLTEVAAEVACDPRGVVVRSLTARCGQAQLQLAGRIEGYDGCGAIDLAVAARELALEHLPLGALPEGLRKVWDQFRPQGMADVTGRLRFDGQRWLPELEVRCRPLAIRYAGFPYPLSDGQGTIRLQGEAAGVDLCLVGGGQPIRCRAEIAQPGASFTGWIELASEGAVPIDARLLNALPPEAQRVVRALRPRGNVQFAARFERPRGDAALRRQMRIVLEDCSIQHERFPYPIDQVQGLLVQEGGDWYFRNLSGRNDSGQIVGEGSWIADGMQRRLTLQFTAQDVPLEDELAQALPAGVQRLWASLGPRGHLERLRVLLRHTAPLGPWSVEVWADQRLREEGDGGRTIALEPAAIRYPLHQVTGHLHYRDGQIELAGFRARHGRSTIVADGVCRLLPEGGYHLDLTRCAVDRLELDRELVAAAGEPLAAMLAQFPLEGPMHAAGSLSLWLPPEPGVGTHVQWKAELDLEGASLRTSPPVTHLHGGLALSGRYAPEGLFTRGELQIDSAMVGPVQLVRVEGPLWSDGQRLVFGMLADQTSGGQAPRQITCRTLGGLLSLDGELGLVAERGFRLQAALENADLAQIVQELAPHQRGLTGKVLAQLELGGQCSARDTWRGSGRIHLREADIYELPLMVALLKLLSIRRPNRTAFTTSDIELRVEGDELALERIDFSGDAVSLKGRGRIRPPQQIELKFYPLVGREEWHLPVMRPLLGETGRELMLIEVTGTLDQPEIRRVPFPRLDAQWQQLFPDLPRDAAGRWPRWTPLEVPRAALSPWRWGRLR